MGGQIEFVYLNIQKNLIMSDKVLVDQLVAHYKELKQEIHKVIVGQDDVVDQVLISIFSKGHLRPI